MAKATEKTRRLVQMSILIAIMLILAFTPLGYLKVGAIDITFMTIPVVVGADSFRTRIRCGAWRRFWTDQLYSMFWYEYVRRGAAEHKSFSDLFGLHGAPCSHGISVWCYFPAIAPRW